MAPRLEGCHKDGDFQRRGPPTLISVHTDDQQKNIRANVLRVFIKVPKYGKHWKTIMELVCFPGLQEVSEDRLESP